MIRLSGDKLVAQLEKGLRPVYLLSGNDPLLLQESQDAIRRLAQQSGFEEHHTVQIDQSTDWPEVFSICQALSLFSARQSLTLLFPENGTNAGINNQLDTLVTYLHQDILLIIRSHKLTKGQENSNWFKKIADNCVLVNCQTPEQAELPQWVSRRAVQMHLELDDAANQRLCYCYEGNLLALSQALERLSLIWPDGKLTLPRVEQAVNDAAHFTPFHWTDALLAGKTKRARHILHQLRQEGCEPVILMRTLQRDLLLLLTLMRQKKNTPLRTLFDQHRIWQTRRPILTRALERLSPNQLNQAVHLLTRAELTLKLDYSQSVWETLETLNQILCLHALPHIFIHEE